MNIYLYIDKNTFFHRLDPRTKLFILLTVFIIATLQEALPGASFVFLLVIFHGYLSKTLVNLKRIWFVLLLIFILSTIIWALNLRGKTDLFNGIDLEPLLYGIGTGIKLDAMIITGLIFLSTTTNEEISMALVKLKLPYRLTFAFTTALRLVPTFIGTALTVVNAQKSRGMELDKGNIFKRIRGYLPLLGPVLLLTLRYTVQLSMALESKGFGASKKRTFYLDSQYKKPDLVIIGLLLVINALCIYLRTSGYLAIEGLIK